MDEDEEEEMEQQVVMQRTPVIVSVSSEGSCLPYMVVAKVVAKGISGEREMF